MQTRIESCVARGFLVGMFFRSVGSTLKLGSQFSRTQIRKKNGEQMILLAVGSLAWFE
jgi:hypothetical protein